MKHVILPSFVHQTGGREVLHDLHAVANQQSVVRTVGTRRLSWLAGGVVCRLPTVNEFMINHNLANQNWNKGPTSQSKLE